MDNIKSNDQMSTNDEVLNQTDANTDADLKKVKIIRKLEQNHVARQKMIVGLALGAAGGLIGPVVGYYMYPDLYDWVEVAKITVPWFLANSALFAYFMTKSNSVEKELNEELNKISDDKGMSL